MTNKLGSTLALVLGVVGMLGVAGSASAAPILIHQYGLNGTFADDLAGPSLVSGGGTIGATGYTFPSNMGLSLSNGIDVDDYSIVLDFSFDLTTGYRKILDFKDRTSDTGLYNLNSSLNFYPNAGSAGLITPNTMVRVALTRDSATDIVNSYVNGVLESSFVDSSGLATFTGANNIAYFFTDDFPVPGEHSPGFVDSISIYDSAFDGQGIIDLGEPGDPAAVPEPGTLLLLGVGLIASGYRLRRRRVQ
jgi:hypothetical protein